MHLETNKNKFFKKKLDRGDGPFQMSAESGSPFGLTPLRVQCGSE